MGVVRRDLRNASLGIRSLSNPIEAMSRGAGQGATIPATTSIVRSPGSDRLGFSFHNQTIEGLQHMQGSNYAKRASWLVSLPMLFSLVACQSSLSSSVEYANKKAEAEGSPFRWKATSVPGGSILVRVLANLPSGPSRAHPTLKQGTLAQIAKLEADAGRTDPQLEDVRLLKDGRELWLLKSQRDGIAYIVDFKQSAQGGTDIGLSKPQAYQRD
jgi:hypothetical protein